MLNMVYSYNSVALSENVPTGTFHFDAIELGRYSWDQNIIQAENKRGKGV